MTQTLNRRHFFQAGAAAAASLGVAHESSATATSYVDEFQYEVIRSPEQWKKLLNSHHGDRDYRLLRLGETEDPKSSLLWDEDRDGAYHCKGCALQVYSSDWKVQLDKGWAFFRHGVPNALLMSVDWEGGAGPDMGLDVLSSIEVHCRRCGSHMGHILLVDGDILHCINGSGLIFHENRA